MAGKRVTKVDLADFDKSTPYVANRMLLEWLSDDDQRAALYQQIEQRGGELEFESREPLPPTPSSTPGAGGTKKVRLITNRDLVEGILRNKDGACTNRVYAQLDGGRFMLAIDSAKPHEAQRQAFTQCFPTAREQVIALSHAACRAASITTLHSSEFDLAEFASQSALRFCHQLMGYALADYPLLEQTLDVGYRALVYQVMGRHFATDLLIEQKAQQAMGALLARTSQLIDAYQADDKDALVGCEDGVVPGGPTPVMKNLATVYTGSLNGEQRATLVVGSAIGIVGNVQAAACIAIKALFADRALWAKARSLAAQECIEVGTTRLPEWQALLQGPLRANPPIPFLPRWKDKGNGQFEEILLALGGGTAAASGGDEPLVWGLPPGAAHGCLGTKMADGSAHWCIGMDMAWPLIVEIVRQVMALPDLAEGLDPVDATPIGLKKRWGFVCESYPLSYRRDKRVIQSSLNVVMRVKSPIPENAERIRVLIRAGAPRIERALREARQVHFAWFELIDNDSACVLHTVYDGTFDAYIQDFALSVGELFDELFEYIEQPPPRPVRKFPYDFVALVKLCDRAPAMGYFYSAYRGSEVTRIQRDALAWP